MSEFRSKLKITTKKNRNEAYVISMPAHERTNTDYTLIRIILTQQETTIDLGYRTADFGKRKEFSLEKNETHLFLKGKNKKFALQNLSNIQKDPQTSWFFFTLHFPPILEEINYNTSAIFDQIPNQEIKFIDLAIKTDSGLYFNKIALDDLDRITRMLMK